MIEPHQHGFLLLPSTLPGSLPMSCSVYSQHCDQVTLLNVSCIKSFLAQNSLMARLHSESSSLLQRDSALHSPTSDLLHSLLLSWLLSKWPSTGASDMLSELSPGLCSHCSYAGHPRVLQCRPTRLDVDLAGK